MFLKENIRIQGIIAEYNPFHKGHAYHIQKSIETTGADYTIVVMSGDFTQRGECALYDKYTRTRMALLGGADLVLELPVIYASSSAEYFARGAIRILDGLNSVDHLSFGAECDDIDRLSRCMSVKDSSADQPSSDVEKLLKSGMSYPEAVEKSISDSTYSDVALNPNNILAIEYLKALKKAKSRIKPIAIQRIQNSYNDVTFDPSNEFASARAIREAVRNSDPSYLDYLPDNIRSVIPDDPLFPDDLSNILYYRLRTLKSDNASLTGFWDVSKEIEGKIYKNLGDFTSRDDFILKLKSRNVTYARLSRSLLHILLDIKKNDPAFDAPPYARILGFKKDAQKLLNILKNNSSIPIISKPKDAPENLCFAKDILSSDLYENIKGSGKNELRQNMIIL